MQKLEELTQENDSTFFTNNNSRMLLNREVLPIGKIKTLVVEHPCLEISDVIDSMAKTNSKFIPDYANAYVVSDFSADTQHIRKSEACTEGKFYSVYAVQFYHM
jgi:hypothetical protein